MHREQTTPRHTQPLQITFRNVPPSRTIERLVREKTRKLERSCDRIVKCHITLESQHQGHGKGSLYDVRLDIHIPGKTFAVTSAQREHRESELLTAAIRDAFDAAERQLRDHMAARRNRSRKPRPGRQGPSDPEAAPHPPS